MSPKFAVGEVCIIQSPNHPHCNGETTVLEVYPPGVEVRGFKREHTEFSYRTDTNNNPIGLSCFRESSLRKKHDPSQYSFNQLMDNIKDMATA